MLKIKVAEKDFLVTSRRWTSWPEPALSEAEGCSPFPMFLSLRIFLAKPLILCWV